MAISINYFVCASSFCMSIVLLYPASCNAKYLFVLRDSLYDVGNSQYIRKTLPSSSYFPYGSTFFHRPTGRFSDGRVIPDFIAMKLGIPFLPPVLDPDTDFTYGANMASAGAGVFEGYPNYVMNLGEQYGNLTRVKSIWIKQLNETEALMRLQEAVYLVSLGGNDYFGFINQNPDATIKEMDEYVDIVVGQLLLLLRKMHAEIGARKFMIQNVGPLGCTPSAKHAQNIMGDGCAAMPLVAAVLHNNALRKMAESLSQELDGFRYSIFDVFTALSHRISNPTKYGFEVGDTACCGNGNHNAVNCASTTSDYYLCMNKSTHVHFDGAHNTDAANMQLAELLWSGSLDIVSPYNMEQLFLQPVATVERRST